MSCVLSLLFYIATIIEEWVTLSKHATFKFKHCLRQEEGKINDMKLICGVHQFTIHNNVIFCCGEFGLFWWKKYISSQKDVVHGCMSCHQYEIIWIDRVPRKSKLHIPLNGSFCNTMGTMFLHWSGGMCNFKAKTLWMAHLTSTFFSQIKLHIGFIFSCILKDCS